MSGTTRLDAVFTRLRAAGRPALMPYFTLGYPTAAASQAIIQAIAGAGADVLELGMPFSDPLADGPTIQHSTQVALEQGMSVAGCLAQLKALRQGGLAQPAVLMGYYNPLLSYGLARFAADAASAGADGLIVPDLPPEEAGELQAACLAHGLALVYLLAPTSTPARIALAASQASGFIYLVSVTGVTGARQALPPDLAGFIQRVRAQAIQPLAVGFGIATPEQAASVGALADGVIVGSALIQVVRQAAAQGTDPAAAAAEFIASLAARLPGG